MGSPIYSIIVFTVVKGDIHKAIPVDLVGPNVKIKGKIITNPIKGPIDNFKPFCVFF
jgi:hypothetical protein